MSESLIFLIVVAVANLVVKSLRDKKNIEKEMEKRRRELRKTTTDTVNPRPVTDLRKILEEEIKRERERYNKKSIQGQANSQKAEVKHQVTAAVKVRDNKEITVSSEIGSSPLENLELSKNDDKRDITLKNKKEKFKRDLVKGIIFSEILSGPRCLQNQRRSLWLSQAFFIGIVHIQGA